MVRVKQLSTKKMAEWDREYVINTYGERPISIVRGRGVKVWDAEGKEYIDLLSGLAVNSLGHCHPAIVKAIKNQAGQLLHVSNLYYTEPQLRLAKILTETSFADKVFFCNSGAEANETAIKLIRRFGNQDKRHRTGIITIENSFHGRTLATLSATGQSKFHRGFDPLLEGFIYVPINDLDAVQKAITDKTCAIMLEPVQGEGGINIASKEYLVGLKDLCDKYDLLLTFDEVQCGLGRTGKLYAYQHSGVEPDIMTLAKSLGGGLPLGAALVRDRVALLFQPGDHASTFGGNPLCCSTGIALMEILTEGNLLKHVVEVGDYLLVRLEELWRKYSFIREVRGIGLMGGMDLEFEGKHLVRDCINRGLLINCTAGTLLRLLPPLIVTKQEIDQGLKILDKVMGDL